MTGKIQNIGTKILLEIPGTCATLFAGTAFYLSEIDPRVMNEFPSVKHRLIHWAKMYALAKKVMPATAIMGYLSAIGAYYKTKQIFWLYGAGALISVVPFTFLALKKINNYLNGVLKDTKGEEVDEKDRATVRDKLKSWVNRHRIRGVLAVVAMGLFFWAKHLPKTN